MAGWQPGDPDLAPDTLISALATEAGLDPDLADLLAGRGDVLTGLGDLTQRWLGTDGLVTLPGTGLPDGVTGHQIPDLAHPTPLGALDLAAVDGLAGAAAAATVVHIAVVAPGLPVVLAAPGTGGGPAADHALDLTAAGRPRRRSARPRPPIPPGCGRSRSARAGPAGWTPATRTGWPGRPPGWPRCCPAWSRRLAARCWS